LRSQLQLLNLRGADPVPRQSRESCTALTIVWWMSGFDRDRATAAPPQQVVSVGAWCRLV